MNLIKIFFRIAIIIMGYILSIALFPITLFIIAIIFLVGAVGNIK